jgi:hypothetical protein
MAHSRTDKAGETMTPLKRALCCAALAAWAMTSASHAQQPKIIGNWMLTVEADRFSDANTKVIAVTMNSAGDVLAVRCLSGQISFALGGERYKEGDQFDIKYRPDKLAIVETTGTALNEKMMEVETSAEMVRSMLEAKEYAFRIMGASSRDVVFKAGAGAAKALAEVTKACPLK